MNRFDELAKVLAGTMPRRTALLKIAGIVGGAVLGLFGLGKKASALTGQAYVNCLRGCLGLPVFLRPRCQLACQCAPRVLCGTICCPAGFSCVAGACVGCTNGGTCGSFVNCPNSSCLCGSTTEGTAFCFQDALCDSLTSCETSADCPAGRRCLVNSCCNGNVCAAHCSLVTPMLQPAVQGVRTSRR
jgi:hypothetical protein